MAKRQQAAALQGRRDWLIDLIVYRLYGLNEEKIRIVEGWEPAAA